MSQALQFLILTTAGWMNRQQEDAIDYLREDIDDLPPPCPYLSSSFAAAPGRRYRDSGRAQGTGREVLPAVMLPIAQS
ncbi:MAG: hypothetical protein ACI8TX_003421 [Hyphomicrobiaceae bacterium]|jgi:hypothetical protein